MSERSRRSRKNPPVRKGNLLVWVMIALCGTVAVALAGLLVWSLATSGGDTTTPKGTPEVTGAPKLKVYRDKIEMGDIKLGQTVQAAFALSNVGDQPLRITG